MSNRPPQRGSLLARWELGLAAFVPALGLLTFRSRGSDLVCIFFIPAVIGVIVLLYGIIFVRSSSADPFEFESIEDLGGEVLGHIGAYLLPIFIDTSRSTEEIAISAIVLALIMHIHVSTGQVLVNPLLYLLGYRIYSARCGGVTYYLVAKSDTSSWESRRRCVRISSSILVERHK